MIFFCWLHYWAKRFILLQMDKNSNIFPCYGRGALRRPRLGVNVLFTVGGDGTQQGAQALVEEIARQGRDIAVVGLSRPWWWPPVGWQGCWSGLMFMMFEVWFVHSGASMQTQKKICFQVLSFFCFQVKILYYILLLHLPLPGIPKTIDNDVAFIQRTFGFSTGVEFAVQCLRYPPPSSIWPHASRPLVPSLLSTSVLSVSQGSTNWSTISTQWGLHREAWWTTFRLCRGSGAVDSVFLFRIPMSLLSWFYVNFCILCMLLNQKYLQALKLILCSCQWHSSVDAYVDISVFCLD